MNLHPISERIIDRTMSHSTPHFWTECYPPDFDHGGEPLLGNDPNRWMSLLDGVAFLGAECSLDGRVVLVVATVENGFVEVAGQYVNQGEAFAEPLAKALKETTLRVPVDRNASRLLGLEVEIDEAPIQADWTAAARRIELDLLSTIHRMASFGH